MNDVYTELKDISITDALSSEVKTLEEFLPECKMLVNAKKHNIKDFKKYTTKCTKNSKQPHSNSHSGRKTYQPFGPGRRSARLPKGTVSGQKTITVNVPSARGGRSAHRLRFNQTKIKMNKKEQKCYRRNLLFNLLKLTKCYIVPNEVFFIKTSEMLKKIINKDLKVLLENHKRGVLICRKNKESTPYAFGNLVNSVLLDENHHSLYKVYSGNFPKVVIFSKEGLLDLFLRIYEN